MAMWFTFVSSISILLCVLISIGDNQSIQVCNDTGTANNGDCHFPFVYDGVTFNQCTYFGDNRQWCSTTYDYSGDKLWGYCDCTIDETIITETDPDNNHYVYTKGKLNNGIIETLVVRLMFINDTNIIQYSSEWLNYVFSSISMFYNDSSYGQLTYNFKYINNYYISNLSSSTVTTSQIQKEAFKFAENNGYIWCGGICGRNDNYFNNLYRLNDKHFDQLIIILNNQNNNNPSFINKWAGLGSIGIPQTWIISFNPSVIQHEFGHNLGLNHQYTNKYKRITTKNVNEQQLEFEIGELYDKESRMGAGGYVNASDQSSRYKSNGHFGPCAKDWYGWYNDSNIIDIDIDNITADMIYKLYPFDRPDIVLNDNKIFLLRISWTSQYEYYSSVYINRMYIYYRTSYAGSLSGISVQFCMLNKLNNMYESGSNIQTFTYDINGNSYTQSDHYINIGNSYILQPFMWSLEDDIFDGFVDPYSAKKLNNINITVKNPSNKWNNCDNYTYICEENDIDLSIEVQISSTENTDLEYEYELECDGSSKDLHINMDNLQYKLVHITSSEIGVYGRGEMKLNLCPNNTHIIAYIFDKYPDNIPITIGSIMSFTFNGNININNNKCLNDLCTIKAIQIIQNDKNNHLHISEIEIYDEINGTINLATNNNQITCYSYPDDINDIEPYLIDGDRTTYSYTYSNTNKDTIIYDLCILNTPINNIKEIKIYPRDAHWYRSSNLTLNLYSEALIGSTYNKNAWILQGLLFTYDIIHDDDAHWDNKHEVITIPSITEIIETSKCDDEYIPIIPMIHGEMYVLLEDINYNLNNNEFDIEIEFNLNECTITQCPINTYSTIENSESLICERCPNNHYTEDINGKSIDECIQCPHHRRLMDDDSSWCSIQECMEVIITHDNGLGNKIDGIYYNLGKREHNQYNIYMSYSLNYAILYNDDNQNYQIIDLKQNNTEIAYSLASNESYPFLLNSINWYESNITHFDNIPHTSIQAIKIIQRGNNSIASYNVLNIAEIEIYPKSNPTLNIGSTHMTCYSFPITDKNIFNWYKGNKTNGKVSELNDNNLQTTTSNGNLNDANYCYDNECHDICILNEAIEIDHIVIYPPQNTWRYYRTNNLLIEMYEYYNMSLDDNNKYLIYSESMSIRVNTTINITKNINNKDKPLQVICPYKYALSCDNLLNELCESHDTNYNEWFARYTSYDNSDFDWKCMNKNYLTNDLLNYQIDVENDWNEYDLRTKSLNINNVNTVLNECKVNYIVEYIETECYVNNIQIENITQHILYPNDEILCYLYIYNSNGNILVYNNLLWSIQLIAISNDYYYYPIKGKIQINDTISAAIIVPNCSLSSWSISLSFDQTSIGGNRLEIWSSKQINIDDKYDNNNEECLQFDCETVTKLVDNIEDTFFDYANIPKHILLECIKDKDDKYYNYSSTDVIVSIDDDNQDNNIATIVGIVIGVLLFMMLIILIIIIIYLKHRKNKLFRLHRNVSISVVGHTNTVQYVNEEDDEYDDYI